MNEKIINHIEKISFQIRDFLRKNHRFDDFIFVDIKSFVSDIIKNKNSSITSKLARKTRSSKSSNSTTWSQIWAIDREEFKKVITNFEKVVDLSFSFSKNHSKEFFKNFVSFAIESFAISRLIFFYHIFISDSYFDEYCESDRECTRFEFINFSFFKFRKLSECSFILRIWFYIAILRSVAKSKSRVCNVKEKFATIELRDYSSEFNSWFHWKFKTFVDCSSIIIWYIELCKIDFYIAVRSSSKINILESVCKNHAEFEFYIFWSILE